ncbi:MAG: septum formation initiator family protein [Candidatus Omnitrophica bacterium]|nr:septum formation initiator family protein [Candidatus Omnitrophota bacterium]
MLRKIPIPLVVLVVITVLFLPGSSRYHQLQEQKKILEKKIADLQKANTDLQERIHKLQTDPVYLEQVARDKMKKTREGEIIYRTR